MKKFVLASLLLAGTSATTFAQVSLTGASINPVAGNSFVSINCDTTGLLLNAVKAARGANKVWDYHTLTTISTDTAVASSCSSTPYCSLMLSSTNFAAKTLSTSAYVYTINNNDSVAVTGYYSSPSQNSILTNPMKMLKYPFTYLDSFVDKVAGTIVFDPGTGPLTASQAGTVTVVADGWGKLVTPIGYDTAVLRVHSYETYIDSVYILGSAGLATVDIHTFRWYKLGYHSPIMDITFIDQVAGFGSIHTKTASYAKRYTVGINDVTEIASSLSIYPNPATSDINVKFEAFTSDAKVRVSLYDIVGREVAVLANTAVNGIQELHYSTANLAKGVYMVRLESGNETITRKVVVE